MTATIATVSRSDPSPALRKLGVLFIIKLIWQKFSRCTTRGCVTARWCCDSCFILPLYLNILVFKHRFKKRWILNNCRITDWWDPDLAVSFNFISNKMACVASSSVIAITKTVFYSMNVMQWWISSSLHGLFPLGIVFFVSLRLILMS